MLGKKKDKVIDYFNVGLYRILIWPDIRPIILPDTGYPAWPDTGYPAGYPGK